jgi:hypothetical protein
VSSLSRNLFTPFGEIAAKQIDGRRVVVQLDGNPAQVEKNPEVVHQIVGSPKLHTRTAKVALFIELNASQEAGSSACCYIPEIRRHLSGRARQTGPRTGEKKAEDARRQDSHGP